MGAVSGAAKRGAHFVLGLTDKLSHAANSIFSSIRSAAAQGASFTIRIGATLVGGAKKLGGKALDAARSLPFVPAQGFAPGFANTMQALAQGGNGNTSMNERWMNRQRADKLFNALESGARSRPVPAGQTATASAG